MTARADRFPRGEAPAGATRSSPARLAMELGVFCALAALAVGQWSRLLADPPAAGYLGAGAAALALAAALGALSLRAARGLLARVAAATATLAALAIGMVAVGWPLSMLDPESWGELVDKLGLGLAGVEDVEMPYGGGDEWLRLTVATGVPLALVAGAALGFWPRRRGPFRVAALVCVVALYGVAVTLDSPGAELLWGVPLLVAIAGWLWIPRLPATRMPFAIATVMAAGLVALPLAGRLDTASAWWDYENWNWFGRDRQVSFNWNHSYGPLEWPTEGTTLFEARTNQPLYWKASVLDRFDGMVWRRASASDPLAARERIARQRAPGGGLPDENRQWLNQATIEIEALASSLVVGSGTPVATRGLPEAARSRDGTLSLLDDEELEGGDEYSVVAYVPEPTPAELRSAPSRYPERRFSEQVLVGLPVAAGELDEARDGEPVTTNGSNRDPEAPEPGRGISMALWGERDPRTDAALAASPYAGMYELARELTAGARHPYDAALAIEQHLSSSYDYTPSVREATYPLAAFLERDRAGYCQQFSGTMALMLRMVGVPARVVSGFAPGSLDDDRNVFEVRDLDAHAWVEVYFRGIGWVGFDPTPAAAPASGAGDSDLAASAFRGRSAVPDDPLGRAQALEAALEGGTLAPSGGDAEVWRPVAIGGAGLAALLAVAATLAYRRRRRALRHGRLAEAQVVELRAALSELGWEVSGDATLLELERRFRTAGRTAIADYAAGLRANRYARSGGSAPGTLERRRLRRALASRRPGRWLRALLAIPPGGPAVGR